VSRARVTQSLNLLCLAPDIQEDLLLLPEVSKGRAPNATCGPSRPGPTGANNGGCGPGCRPSPPATHVTRLKQRATAVIAAAAGENTTLEVGPKAIGAT
jgi:hypothetical protein